MSLFAFALGYIITLTLLVRASWFTPKYTPLYVQRMFVVMLAFFVMTIAEASRTEVKKVSVAINGFNTVLAAANVWAAGKVMEERNNGQA